jgi:hypothetical protein
MHVFVLADLHTWDGPRGQLRSHEAIPWDEAYELYLDQSHLDALITLARAAAGNGERLRGRVFDAMRAIKAAEIPNEYQSRDGGPYVVVTPSAVLHRIELEQYLDQLTTKQWKEARDLARRMSKLTTLQE